MESVQKYSALVVLMVLRHLQQILVLFFINFSRTGGVSIPVVGDVAIVIVIVVGTLTCKMYLLMK